MSSVRLSSLLAMLLALAATPASAHGVVWSKSDAASVVIEFRYTDGTPMSFADVVVRSPDNGLEMQNGRSDRLGRFAFVPDRDGVWHVSADAGDGHVANALPEIRDGRYDVQNKADPFQNSLLHDGNAIRVLSGFSLILNLMFAAWFVRKRLGRH